MATLFIDYQQLVRQAYERKKENNMLPHGLLHLTAANLRDECLKKCTKDVNRRDEKIIRDFCMDLKEESNCHTIIQRCDTDKFKPLVNYLKDKTGRTDVKNIELLAWLIDFAGRPWELGKTVYGDDGIKEDTDPQAASPATGDQVIAPAFLANLSATGNENPPGIPENPEIPVCIDGKKEEKSEGVKTVETSNLKKLRGKSTKTLAAAIMLSLVLGTGSMWWWKEKNSSPLSGSCMYWKEDHYEPIACNQKIPNARIIALDTMKLKNFRKITRPDTITYQAIGKVWYSKINGKLEYYTLDGDHPVVFDRHLKPITAHIINTYILSGMTSN